MFDPTTYRKRRKELVNSLSGGLVFIPGNEDTPMNYRANTYHFRQDSSFLYYFGLDQQGLAGIIDVDENKHILIGDDQDLDDIIWSGVRPSISELGEKCGTDECLATADLDYLLGHAVRLGRKIHYLPPYRSEKILRIGKSLGIHHNEVVQGASSELIRSVVKQRSFKTPQEIEEIEKPSI
jgi:Xaa-Pro aminopeptidase